VSKVVVVCGSRYKDADGQTRLRAHIAVREIIRKLPLDTLVITGGAPGVDTWAHGAAVLRGLSTKRMPAKWRENGVYNPSAGFERDRLMLDEQPDEVKAVWDGSSTGTADTLSEARRRGIPVEVIVA
jgi:predicted Rossmann-fold nucleotide-binding protein